MLANPLWPRSEEIWWSLDNAAVHRWALEGWGDAGGWHATSGMKGHVWELPPYSPDLHQVVEHAIANLCRQFREELWGEVANRKAPHATVHGYAELIQRAFSKACNQQAINHNVMRLPHVYQSVQSARGEWAEKNLR